MKTWKKVILIILSILLGIGLLIGGGYLYMKHKQQEEQAYMEKVAYSDEMTKEYKEILHQIDPHAFTNKGVIHSYTIDKSSIKRNPMGGINVTLFVNNDKNMYVHSTINNYHNKFEIGSYGYSSELDQLIEEKR